MDRFTITAKNNTLPTLFHYTKDRGIPKKLVAAVYVCADAGCDMVLVGNHSTEFNCPACKTGMKAGQTTEVAADDLKGAKPVGVCSFCASATISASNALPSFEQGKFYCPVCSETTASLLKADESDENPDGDSGDGDGDAENPEQSDMGPDSSDDGSDDGSDEEEGEDDEEENGDGSDGDSGDGSEDGDAGTTSTASDDGEGNSSENGDGDSGDGSDESGDDDGKTDGDGDEGGDDGDGSADDGDQPEKGDEAADVGGSKNDDAMEASLLAAIGDREVEIDLIPTANRKKWFLMADNVPVAVAEKGRASEGVREHFDTDKFAVAYHAASKDGATEDMLKEFGFEPIVTKVPVDEAIRQQVEAQVSEKARAYNLNAGDYNERMTRCFGLATMGMIKGTFKDKNPVQDALVASLHRVGVADAQNIVASNFEKHSPALFKTLMLRADELMQKDDSAVTEIAKIVDDQPLPTERAVKKGIPPAAMAVLEEERIDKTVREVQASDGGSDGYTDIFQRRRGMRG